MNRMAPWIVAALLVAGCGQDGRGEAPPYDTDFDIPRTENFAASLAAYGLYRAPLADLQPADGAVLYELSSALFTDHAKKQRLVRLPAGATVDRVGERLVFPEGTVLAKTFYYPADARAPDADRRVIETRLLVKADGQWNVATYLWNAEQTDATLLLDGATTDVSWIDEAGRRRSTTYAVPHEGECVTCHQSGGVVAWIGPSLRNLDRSVHRGGATVDQLDHLVDRGVLADGDRASAPTMPDHRDPALPLDARARAYLDINCAHCHNPDGWDAASERRFDLRFSTPFDESGIARKADDLVRVLESGEMPYLGTTLLDEAGVRLVLDYIDGL